ncbi:MAG TPA: response regulator [Candidatus Limnocylindria bacterium]|nr:response regulator [Candidatus Limnocylindria bacterium]
MAGEKIVFADDEEQIRKLVTAFLQRRGYVVQVAADGMEALRLVREDLPHLVITDVNMPYMNGLELTRRLRENHKTSRVPIVMLSARKQAEDILSGYQVGADDYVPKPVEMAVLAAKVETLLRRTQALAAAQTPARQGNVVVFLHGKGGVGATTLGANLAVALRSGGTYRSAVVDLNTEFPNAAMLFDLKPERTLADVSEGGIADLDEATFGRLVATHQASGVELITASDRPETSELVSLTVMQQALDRMRSRADYVVIDTPPSFTQMTLAAVDASDLAVVVTSAHLPSLKAALDCFFVLAKLQYPRERTLLVLNRTSGRGLDFDQVQQFFGRKPDIVVANTPLFDDAADQGKPLVQAAPDSAGAQSVRELAGRVTAAAPIA